MRPVVWGFILTVTGAVFWILFSIVFGVIYGLAMEEPDPFSLALICISWITMVFSLPVSIAIEIYRWISKK